MVARIDDGANGENLKSQVILENQVRWLQDDS